MVNYHLAPGGPIVFEAEIDGFGPVTITSRKRGIFNGRLLNRPVLLEALKRVEDFADQHEDELAELYQRLAQGSAA